jgi:type IV pilus assembly protein PilQ
MTEQMFERERRQRLIAFNLKRQKKPRGFDQGERMRRQWSMWNGILPLVLGAAIFLCCNLDCTGTLGEARAQTAGYQDASGSAETCPPSTPGTVAVPKKPSRAAARTAAQGGRKQPLPDSIGVPAVARKEYTGKPISLDLMDADLRNVLRLLSDLTGTNIVIEPDVTGKVTLKVEQVPWDQVLDMVLSMNDLGKEQVGNVIRVAKQGKLRQEWTQQVESIKARQELAESTKDLGELASVYFSVNFAKPTEVAAKISESKSDRGKVSVDDRTSLIIYTDYPARVANARTLLARLDRPTPQVLIEARIITLKSDVTRNLGVNLNFKSTQPASQANSPTFLQEFALNAPSATGPQFAMNLAQLVGNTLLQVDMQISALQTANEARVVAAPRVLTLDNVKAVVTQGTQIPYLAVGDTAANITATQFKDATLELQVVPHITPDRKVRMEINAKQDTVSSTTGAQGQPGIDTRKISTELLVDDGNVIVIGGVINNQSTHGKTATPGLSDIPLLGRLFKIETSEDQKNELLIFISPRIVEVNKPADRT